MMRSLKVGAAAVALALVMGLTACSPAGLADLLGQSGSGGNSQRLPEKPEGTVAGMGEQQLDWTRCGSGLQCADAWAPLDWNDPAGELITLRLVKHEAKSKQKLGTLFVNPGGPGASGVDYLTNNLDYAIPTEIQSQYDVVAWDPRGVGASTPIVCLDAAGMDEYLYGESDTDYKVGSDEWIDEAIDQNREFGEACVEKSGDLVGHVGTAETIRDLDMLRAIVGDEKLNYLGFSYGTFIGARYADAFPQNVGRLVLDGAMDPTTSISEVVKAQTKGFEEALRAYVTDCLTRSDCPFTGTVDSAMGQISKILDAVEQTPLQGDDGRVVSSGTMITAIVTPLYAQSNWGYLDQLFTTASRGDAEVALMLADSYNERIDGEYVSNSTESFSAINCQDYPERDVDRDKMRADAAELAKLAPTIGRFQGYGDLSCAGWPVASSDTRGPVTAAGADPILVVGTTGDPATPYQWAQSLSKQLENSKLITYVGEGHTAYGESNCVDQAVNDYLLEGVVPKADLTCKN